LTEGDLPRTNCIKRSEKRGFELEIPSVFPRKNYTGNPERKKLRVRRRTKAPA
jgi:hypothetical protein